MRTAAVRSVTKSSTRCHKLDGTPVLCNFNKAPSRQAASNAPGCRERHEMCDKFFANAKLHTTRTFGHRSPNENRLEKCPTVGQYSLFFFFFPRAFLRLHFGNPVEGMGEPYAEAAVGRRLQWPGWEATGQGGGFPTGVGQQLRRVLVQGTCRVFCAARHCSRPIPAVCQLGGAPPQTASRARLWWHRGRAVTRAIRASHWRRPQCAVHRRQGHQYSCQPHGHSARPALRPRGRPWQPPAQVAALERRARQLWRRRCGVLRVRQGARGNRRGVAPAAAPAGGGGEGAHGTAHWG